MENVKKFTIKDLAAGKCAVINDGSIEELKEVLRRAFPDDKEIPIGSCKYYFKSKFFGYTSADFSHISELPTQSVKDFLVVEDQPFQYEYKWYDVREVLPDERFDGKKVAGISFGNNNTIYGFIWDDNREAFLYPASRLMSELVQYWCPLPTLPQ